MCLNNFGVFEQEFLGWFQSLHGHSAARAGVDLVSNDDFFCTSPPVLVAPHVAPVQKVCHRQERNSHSFHERLSANHGEEEERGSSGEQTVLEAT